MPRCSYVAYFHCDIYGNKWTSPRWSNWERFIWTWCNCLQPLTMTGGWRFSCSSAVNDSCPIKRHPIELRDLKEIAEHIDLVLVTANLWI